MRESLSLVPWDLSVSAAVGVSGLSSFMIGAPGGGDSAKEVMETEARASAVRLSRKLVSVLISCRMGMRPLAGARVAAKFLQDSLCLSPLVRRATTRAAATRFPSQR
eukprot:9017385-Pyramimonas_sp.AAC.1